MDLSASIFAANRMNLQDDINRVLDKIDSLHFDVMDGQFVNNFALPICLYSALYDKFNLPIDVHLMTISPSDHINLFPNARTIFVHTENQLNINQTIQSLHHIKGKGIRAGIALNPETPLCQYEDALTISDEILIMTVRPGLSGQKFMDSMLEKISQAAAAFPNKTITIDGGVNFENLSKIKADKVIMGSGLFKDAACRACKLY